MKFFLLFDAVLIFRILVACLSSATSCRGRMWRCPQGQLAQGYVLSLFALFTFVFCAHNIFMQQMFIGFSCFFFSSNCPNSPNNYRLWRIAKICAFHHRAPRIARIQMAAASSPAATVQVPPATATKAEIAGKYNLELIFFSFHARYGCYRYDHLSPF